jgi:FAD:protein FMN transferase
VTAVRDDRSAFVRHVEPVMGTAVSFDLRSPIPEPGSLGRAIDWLHGVDATFSTHRMDSEISRLALGDVTLDEVGERTREILDRCVALGTRTNGAFDAFAVPAPNGTRLDPSGLVKGWSIEVAAEVLEAGGATNFTVNAGGDIVFRGRPNPGRGWRAGIRHPEDPQSQARVLEVCGPLGLATSGHYERGVHIIDPRAPMGPMELASATVIGPDLGEADAFATAMFVMGLDGLDWIEDQGGYEAFLITLDDRTCWSSGFEEMTVRRDQPE